MRARDENLSAREWRYKATDEFAARDVKDIFEVRFLANLKHGDPVRSVAPNHQLTFLKRHQSSVHKVQN